jgi:hypothetical protein
MINTVSTTATRANGGSGGLLYASISGLATIVFTSLTVTDSYSLTNGGIVYLSSTGDVDF